MRLFSLPKLGTSRKNGLIGLALSGVLATLAPSAMAQEFRLAMSSPPTSMDPHFYNLFPNLNVSDHIFETLVKMDPDSRVVPGLAESWTDRKSVV